MSGTCSLCPKPLKARGLCDGHYKQARAGKIPLPPKCRQNRANTGHLAEQGLQHLLTTSEVCRRTGATYRQIDYWARTGMVSPEYDCNGSGTVRGWGEIQVDAIRAVVMLNRYKAPGGGYDGKGAFGLREIWDIFDLISAGATGDWAVITEDESRLIGDWQAMRLSDSFVAVRFRKGTES